ncbi:MAG: hypothetical protein KGL39_15535 [Patescibacteria group bacterium]|nr:hypothetical protein [Patescibacteria group bacterium]
MKGDLHNAQSAHTVQETFREAYPRLTALQRQTRPAPRFPQSSNLIDSLVLMGIGGGIGFFWRELFHLVAKVLAWLL